MGILRHVNFGNNWAIARKVMTANSITKKSANNFNKTNAITD